VATAWVLPAAMTRPVLEKDRAKVLQAAFRYRRPKTCEAVAKWQQAEGK